MSGCQKNIRIKHVAQWAHTDAQYSPLSQYPQDSPSLLSREQIWALYTPWNPQFSKTQRSKVGRDESASYPLWPHTSQNRSSIYSDLHLMEWYCSAQGVIEKTDNRYFHYTIRTWTHQNFLFCQIMVSLGTIRNIKLIISHNESERKKKAHKKENKSVFVFDQQIPVSLEQRRDR